MVFSFRMASFGRKSGVGSSKDKAFERTEEVLPIPAYALCKCAQVAVGTSSDFLTADDNFLSII